MLQFEGAEIHIYQSWEEWTGETLIQQDRGGSPLWARQSELWKTDTELSLLEATQIGEPWNDGDNIGQRATL